MSDIKEQLDAADLAVESIENEYNPKIYKLENKRDALRKPHLGIIKEIEKKWG